MESRAVTASWALARTTTDVLSISRGVFEAATTDNVQSLAILACEGFGATLAMSDTTNGKVQHLCSQDHESTARIELPQSKCWLQAGRQ